jgi:hypothetical protein
VTATLDATDDQWLLSAYGNRLHRPRWLDRGLDREPVAACDRNIPLSVARTGVLAGHLGLFARCTRCGRHP